jgi:hypothetical protein
MRASPGFGAAATIATTANTNGIRQHLVAASRTKKTHPPEGDPLATLIDTPPLPVGKPPEPDTSLPPSATGKWPV